MHGRDEGQPYSYATRVQVLVLTPGGSEDKEADFVSQGRLVQVDPGLKALGSSA